jgi:hypothetical protein
LLNLDQLQQLQQPLLLLLFQLRQLPNGWW